MKKNKTMRKKVVAGNWKMNTTLTEGIQLAKEVSLAVREQAPQDVTVILGVPFTHLTAVSQTIDKDRIGLSSQNCAAEVSGAYTGEVSAAMVASTGAEYAILGHSERREYYRETAEVLNKKLALALENKLTPIYCCGESLEIRESETQNNFVKKQLDETVFLFPQEEFKKMILAYEPIWAIGTGRTATSVQAQEMHAFIRGLIAERYDNDTAQGTSILYGGSCNASNASELFAGEDIDGGLIGGASLKATDFIRIITAY